MAEGLLRSLGQNEYEVHSAGTHPSFVRPQAIQVMKEIGVDISNHSSKSLDQFVAEPFDYVITVCDNVRESCPFFAGAKEMLHWSIEDPVNIWGTEEMQLEAFRKARDEIRKRIEKTFKTDQTGETRISSEEPNGFS
jgi:arsenate reductase